VPEPDSGIANLALLANRPDFIAANFRSKGQGQSNLGHV